MLRVRLPPSARVFWTDVRRPLVREGLGVTVVLAVSTRPCQGRRAGSNLVGHSLRGWCNGSHARPRPVCRKA